MEQTNLTFSHSRLLPVCAVIAERNPLTNEYIDNIRKFLPLLRSREFAMHDAAAYLEAWITGTWQMKPLMAVDARLDCKIDVCMQFFERRVGMIFRQVCQLNMVCGAALVTK